ncbi:acyl-CoA dehydrogenase family protein [Nocardioides deserti]|uniref:Acyl-CoA/acyl-ACP dehydrogenase n=1 Tax=Nocardioides deserti TaxID=1588644 RepID=A0ABR6U8J8_9ACTN|nr:acyl-CoA dehydrogenase family protein [Nocardioides deserti]MBC2960161.1 acyl-CoA/acyl-ACP dehydrogenase [Nocardioides deserti]GGO74743.1 hypothetical protein GCM10012276_23430 [Nocardioides deserti]
MPNDHDRTSAAAIRLFFDQRAADSAGGDRHGSSDLLRHLGARGLIDAPTLRATFDLIRGVARADLAAAFSLWSHAMVLECLRAAPTALLAEHATRLRQPTAWGSTAMAPTIKYLAGLGDLPVTYRRHDVTLVLDGRIPWASNLFDDNVVLVLTARSADPAGGDPLVLAVDGRDPTVRLGAPLPLLALESTASSTVELDGTRIPSGAVISDDLTGYMRAMKPRLLLLQTAYCLGLADAAITAGAEGLHRAAPTHLTEHSTLAATTATLTETVRTALDALDNSRNPPISDIVRTRLHAAQVAGAAVALEVRLAGGAGFLATSPTARRHREAAFLPIQTPTESQLFLELGREGIGTGRL